MIINEAKSRLTARFDKTIKTWQGLVNGNITFTDELAFDSAELDMVYEDNDAKEQ